VEEVAQLARIGFLWHRGANPKVGAAASSMARF